MKAKIRTARPYPRFAAAGLDPAAYAELFNANQDDTLMARLNMHWTAIEAGHAQGRMVLEPWHFAGNGYVHAGSVVAFADTACGHGCTASRPEGAYGFTTVELKSNFIGTARGGALICDAALAHGGRTTQIWDCKVIAEAERRVIALFRCTQLLLWPTPGTSA
jgi:1,4-dihydroxy-2-naphthoyl-CoA hydrolase